MSEIQLAEIESLLGVKFNDPAWLQKAFTHRSVFKEEPSIGRDGYNERLEFLGDAVLSLVTAEEVFSRNPHADEGVLSQLRAQYVCEANLAKAALKLNLGNYIRAGRAMRGAGPINLPSLLADTMEALIGAVYLDSGFAASKAVIERTLGPVPERVTSAPKDAKTELQERVQALVNVAPMYSVVESSGPSHAPNFIVEVYMGGCLLSRGQGPSKKEAAQDSARLALELTQEWTKAQFEEQLLRAKQ